MSSSTPSVFIKENLTLHPQSILHVRNDRFGHAFIEIKKINYENLLLNFISFGTFPVGPTEVSFFEIIKYIFKIYDFSNSAITKAAKEELKRLNLNKDQNSLVLKNITILNDKFFKNSLEKIKKPINPSENYSQLKTSIIELTSSKQSTQSSQSTSSKQSTQSSQSTTSNTQTSPIKENSSCYKKTTFGLITTIAFVVFSIWIHKNRKTPIIKSDIPNRCHPLMNSTNKTCFNWNPPPPKTIVFNSNLNNTILNDLSSNTPSFHPHMSSTDKDPHMSSTDKDPQMSSTDKDPLMSSTDKDPQMSSTDKDTCFNWNSPPPKTIVFNSNFDTKSLMFGEKSFLVRILEHNVSDNPKWLGNNIQKVKLFYDEKELQSWLDQNMHLKDDKKLLKELQQEGALSEEISKMIDSTQEIYLPLLRKKVIQTLLEKHLNDIGGEYNRPLLMEILANNAINSFIKVDLVRRIVYHPNFKFKNHIDNKGFTTLMYLSLMGYDSPYTTPDTLSSDKILRNTFKQILRQTSPSHLHQRDPKTQKTAATFLAERRNIEFLEQLQEVTENNSTSTDNNVLSTLIKESPYTLSADSTYYKKFKSSIKKIVIRAKKTTDWNQVLTLSLNRKNQHLTPIILNNLPETVNITDSNQDELFNLIVFDNYKETIFNLIKRGLIIPQKKHAPHVFFMALESKEANIAEKILDQGLLDLSTDFFKNNPPLIMALKKDLNEIANKILERNDINVNSQDFMKKSALIIAIEQKKTNFVEKLLKKPNLNISLQDFDKCSPLMVAAFENQTDLVDKILERDDIEFKNDWETSTRTSMLGKFNRKQDMKRTELRESGSAPKSTEEELREKDHFTQNILTPLIKKMKPKATLYLQTQQAQEKLDQQYNARSMNSIKPYKPILALRKDIKKVQETIRTQKEYQHFWFDPPKVLAIEDVLKEDWKLSSGSQ